MRPSDSALRALWARASTLDERLSGDFVPVPGGEADADMRWEAWRVLAAEGDPRRMARRLNFDHLQEARVRPLLGTVAARPGAALPPEFDLLADALAPQDSLQADAAVDDVLGRLPFAEVLGPFLRVAQRRLDQRLDGQLAATVPALRAGCARGLAERLCEQAGPTLAALFEAEHAQAAAGCYQRLLQHTTGADAAAFWHTHAAMARALAIVAHHWVAASAEMLLRWQADADALAQAFGPRAAGVPVALQTGLGDPHRGGRGVARLHFASGLDLYYKPRALSLDRAYAGLLDQMRRDGVVDDLQVPALLARPGYGWVEGVAARPASDREDVERYFERGGALLCLAHLLDITDCHSGNVIAAGDQPVLIDLETVCHQRARDLEEDHSDAERRARQTIAVSVLGCGLLPDARMEGALRVELGGLSPGLEAVQHTTQARWVDLGLDTMRREWSPLAVGDGAHQLVLDGSVVSVREQGPALRRGFTRMARHAMARREAWCAPGGPLAAFAACEARFVFRGTLVYSALLNRFTAPDLAQEGVDRSLLLEALARPLLDAETAPTVWPLLAAERAAMAQLDVPHFSTPVAEAVLHVDGGAPIAGYLQATGVARLRSRLLSFGEADLARELAFIDSALVRPLAAADAAVAPVPAAALPPVDTAALRAAAMDIAERLETLAVWGDDGSATWMDASMDARDDSLAWRSLSPWLGDGVAGLALTLAALERTGAGSRVRRLRLGAQRHLALGLAQIAAQPLGGLTGAPSVAYALARVAALTGDRSALALAGVVVETVPLDAIAADEIFDVAGGVAGTLLCLATVRDIAEAAGEQAVAQGATLRIRACAARLAAASAQVPDGLLPTVAGRVLTGLSHGQSGFALAIARLRDGDGAAELQPMARAALVFERDHRDAAAGNWLDLRPDASTPCSCAWCHGAPGIGLVRAVLRAREAADAELAEDLALAARSTCAEPDAALDHLCCGNMGLVACTQLLAESLDDPALMAGAHQRAARVLARAKTRGGYSTLLGAPAGQQTLGLFTGLAGVGYALLRLAEPRLPSVLTLA
jgi:type 2 lantibiotic biosynthesis protein LanM